MTTESLVAAYDNKDGKVAYDSNLVNDIDRQPIIGFYSGQQVVKLI